MNEMLAQSAPALALLVLGACARSAAGPDAEQARERDDAGEPQLDARKPDRLLPRHEVIQFPMVGFLPAVQEPAVPGSVEIRLEGEHRLIVANGVPSHRVVASRGPEVQAYEVRIPANPKRAAKITKIGNQYFGFAVNGVPFAPTSNEFYLDDRSNGWEYEVLGGSIHSSIDVNGGHVWPPGPPGPYHYHGVPHGLLDELGCGPDTPSPLVGWAADGFPIYAPYSHDEGLDSSSPLEGLYSSYVLRKGDRPRGEGQPGGTYDGTFSADYRFAPGAGELDACNGREVVTPEFPEGTYAYYLTYNYPYIPRCFVGEPVLLEQPRRNASPG